MTYAVMRSGDNGGSSTDTTYLSSLSFFLRKSQRCCVFHSLFRTQVYHERPSGCRSMRLALIAAPGKKAFHGNILVQILPMEPFTAIADPAGFPLGGRRIE